MEAIEAVCHVCNRENSNPGDPIVFCDQCHTPYHRFCHKPPIDRICIDVPDVRWYCHDCIGQQSELALETGVSGNEFDPETRQAYLSSLTKSQLIQLIQYAETIHPELPIYSPSTRKHVACLEQEKDDIRQIEYQMRPGNEDLVVGIVTDLHKKHPESLGFTSTDIWKELERERDVKQLDASFKHSAVRALQRALRKGRVMERSGKYLPNPDYQPSSELHLTQLLKADDNVMFSHMPLRIPVAQEQNEIEKTDVFSHRIYVI